MANPRNLVDIAPLVSASNTGNLGIGTTAPVTKLHVTSAGSVGSRIENTLNNGAAYLQVKNTAGSTYLGQDSIGGYLITDYAAPLLFYTNNTERMRLDTSGNLGIGTTSPGAKLELYTAGTVNLRLNGSLVGGNTVDFYNYVPAVSNDGFSIFIGGTNRLTMTNSGNLGIGTNSPGQKLDVNGNAAIRLPSIGGSVDLQFPYFGATNAKTIIRATGTSDWRQTLKIQMNTAQSDSAPVDVLTLDSSGNLGLGVTPSGWNAGGKAIEVGGAGSIFYGTTSASGITRNASYVSGWKYQASAAATFYEQYAGTHAWHTSIDPTPTAGNAISFTQSLTLNANGALVLRGGNTGADGVGITFPATQSASSNANTLDDYEEGTWTPTNAGNITGFTNSSGTYTKVGRVVYFRGSYDLTGNTSNMDVGGLPFTSASTLFFTLTYRVPNITVGYAFVADNSTVFQFNVNNTYSGSTFSIAFAGWYFSAS